jgi:uncharacterized protein (DUF58 family)
VTRTVEPDRVMRGDPCTATLAVRNIGRVPTSVLAHDRCGFGTVPVPLLRLPAGQEVSRTYPVPTGARGVVRVGPLRVDRRDPLGLARAARSQGGTAQVWVHPRIHPLTAVPSGRARSLEGLVDQVPHGSITFDHLREYVVGDELRRVHWRTSARLGELMVREQVDTSLPRLVVLLDDRAAAYPGARAAGSAVGFESACEAAASVVMAAARQELPVALRLASGAAAGGDGRRLGLTTTSTDLLDLLAEAVLVPGDPLGGTVTRLRQERAGDTLIFLTGPAGSPAVGTVAALRGAYPSIAVGLLGADADPATRHGLLVLSAADGEDFARVWDGVAAW